jgi:hypothetical protein
MNNEFKSVKIRQEDHRKIKEYGFYNELKDYQVMGLALRCLEKYHDELLRDHDANQPLFQSSAK